MILFLTQVNPFSTMIKPIVDLLNMVIAPALLLVGAIGSIYCILLGVKLTTAGAGSRARQGRYLRTAD